MSAKLIVDPTGRPAGPIFTVFVDPKKATTECAARNAGLRERVDTVKGDYFSLVDVEVVE